MAEIIDVLKEVMHYVIEICSVGLVFAGIVVLVSTAFICFVKWVRRDRENIRLDLAQGIALALDFKMGGEVLRTVIVREMGELVVLGAIIILRAAMTFLIHWEIVNEKKEMKEAAKARAALKRAKSHKNSGEPHSGGENTDYLQEVEMTYEDNFRRPSLGHHSPNED